MLPGAGNGPRLAARALILIGGRLLLVNAYPGGQSDLWCAPGGGVDRHASIPDNLTREVAEETGLSITVGQLALVNEFHDPAADFHQVELFFYCAVVAGTLDPAWTDPEGVVNRHRLVTSGDLATLRHKPDSLAAVAWSRPGPPLYDPLERLVR
ncbi:MAG: NUDIX domain-containing protein [Paracoccaceae bacterium]